MQYNGILKELKSISNPRAIDGMAKYGAGWIASDAIHELASKAVQERIRLVGIAMRSLP